jgi:uncharacterized small protein (DUF1192 family)
MTVHTDRIVLVFPIEAKGRNAAASLQTLEIVGNREFEEIVPLDPAKMADYAPAFNLAALAERDAEKSDHDSTKALLATAETARDDASSQIAVLQSQVDTIPGLLSQIAAMTAEVERLTALIPKPLGPREITAEAFFARLSLEDVIAIMCNKDPRVVLAVVRLFVRSEVIDLDSDILKGLIAGLVDSGVPFDDADLARIFA